MPNLEFYATPTDVQQLLDLVFGWSGCRVFESYSRPNHTLREFHTRAEAMAAYGEDAAIRAPSLLLQLVVPGAADLFRIVRFTISNPVGSRERLEGWGLIQLALNGDGPDGIRASHMNHHRWSRLHAVPGDEDRSRPTAEAQSVSGALNRRIRKLAVGTIGTRLVLPSAHAAFLTRSQPEDLWGRSLIGAYRLGLSTDRKHHPATLH